MHDQRITLHVKGRTLFLIFSQGTCKTHLTINVREVSTCKIYEKKDTVKVHEYSTQFVQNKQGLLNINLNNARAYQWRLHEFLWLELNELCQCHAFPLSALECQFYLHLTTLIFTPKNKVLTFVLPHLTLFLSTEKPSPFLRICKQSNKVHRESVTLKEYMNDFIVNFRCFSFLWFLSWRH